ncbi:hypothetical protein CPB86DRAFT_328954 [Serendipita vermifera]|nr:hypothetical protein CPB86DRAFT_328954 [Serendipita vermifera]
MASGLFYKACYLKRSCQPNVHGHWSDGKLHIRAMKNILAGKELLLCTSMKGILDPRSQRHQKLRDQYGFECDCEPPDRNLFNSDIRRKFIRQVVDRIHLDPQPNASDRWISDIRRALDYMEAEDIMHYRDTLWFALFKACEKRLDSDNQTLQGYLENARDWVAAMTGNDDPRYLDISQELDIMSRH